MVSSSIQRTETFKDPLSSTSIERTRGWIEQVAAIFVMSPNVLAPPVRNAYILCPKDYTLLYISQVFKIGTIVVRNATIFL